MYEIKILATTPVPAKCASWVKYQAISPEEVGTPTLVSFLTVKESLTQDETIAAIAAHIIQRGGIKNFANIMKLPFWIRYALDKCADKQGETYCLPWEEGPLHENSKEYQEYIPTLQEEMGYAHLDEIHISFADESCFLTAYTAAAEAVNWLN